MQVLSASNAMAGVQPNLEMGEHEVCCRFDAIPLRPFTYGLKLQFVDHRNGTLWLGESIRYTAVAPGQADITKFPSAGLVFTPTTWTFGQGNEPAQFTRDRATAE